MYSIDIDIGGTFTDGFFTDGSEIRTDKVLTTPHDITEGFMACVQAGARAWNLDLAEFLRRTGVARVSTTVGTNLLVQRAGPKLGLIVTKGHERDLYGKGNAAIVGRYIAPELVAGVAERVSDTGKLETEIDPDALLAAVRSLVQANVRMIVVSFKNAWRNPANERRALEVTRARYPVHYLRSVPMQLATEVMHVADDHARTNTAVFNAYIHGEMARTLYRAEDKLRAAGYERPLLVVHSSGGNARVAKTVAVHTLHSGPAVAARGAGYLAQLLKLDRVVTSDMGGTSFDVSVLADGSAKFNLSPSIDGVPIATPMIEVESLGAGGGSIARVDNGKLRVGPESASSAPGPACYAKGGMEPTVTDANLVLGFIDPEYFLGGRMKLDPNAARRAIDRRVARGLSAGIEEAAWDIRRKITEGMAAELRQRLGDGSRSDGSRSDPSGYTLFSFGGGGPLHAADIADIVGIDRIMAFPFGSVFSAFGGSTTNVQHLYARTLTGKGGAKAALAELKAQAAKDMAGEGFAAKDVTYTTSNSDGMARLTAEAAVAHWKPPRGKPVRGIPQPKATRAVRWRRDAAIDTPIYDRAAVQRGQRIAGPAIVEGPDTSYAAPPGWTLSVDGFGNFVIARES
ncbi:MAG TPA: hydantoinase/oxoprolinase family protein [Alphaproteobacteria bacterium]